MSDAHRSTIDRQAALAAAALERAQAQGVQLGLFGDGPGEERQRGANKTQSAVSKWLAAQGFSSPIEAIAKHAGLHLQGDATIKAMAMVDVMEAWATRGECHENGTIKRFTPEYRANLAGAFMAEQRKAAEALAPYTAKKLSPDVQVNANTNNLAFVMGNGSGGGTTYAPPPLPEKKAQQNQGLIESNPMQSEDRKSEDR